MVNIPSSLRRLALGSELRPQGRTLLRSPEQRCVVAQAVTPRSTVSCGSSSRTLSQVPHRQCDAARAVAPCLPRLLRDAVCCGHRPHPADRLSSASSAQVATLPRLGGIVRLHGRHAGMRRPLRAAGTGAPRTSLPGVWENPSNGRFYLICSSRTHGRQRQRHRQRQQRQLRQQRQ